ncbi:MAG: hypothetical protein JNN05_04305 [Candidatus Omnitrophica bacterium]|nr:hypothetical protein [Candidatus Omnitrophota bacterium]
MKAILNNMRRSLKPALSVLFSAVVLYSGLLLCCQVGLASVHGQGIKVRSCCQTSAAHQLKQKADKSCKCCGISKTILDRVGETFLSARLSSLLDKQYVAAFDHFWPSRSHPTVLAFNSQGPPRFTTIVPLYIEHSNLRL